MILITVNGQVHDLAVDEDTSLLWVLRDHLGLMGINYSCGIGECGDSTVLLDGESELSCQVKLGDVSGQQVTTISVGIKYGCGMVCQCFLTYKADFTISLLRKSNVYELKKKFE